MKAHFEKETRFENESMFLEKVKSYQSLKKLQLAKIYIKKCSRMLAPNSIH